MLVPQRRKSHEMLHVVQLDQGGHTCIVVYGTKLTQTFLKTADGNFKDQARAVIPYYREFVFQSQAGQSLVLQVFCMN